MRGINPLYISGYFETARTAIRAVSPLLHRCNNRRDCIKILLLKLSYHSVYNESDKRAERMLQSCRRQV